MPSGAVRRLSQIPAAAWALAVSAVGLAALALPSSTALIEHAFVRSLGEPASRPTVEDADEVIGGRALSSDLWLTRSEPHTTRSAAAAAIGDRITLAVEPAGVIELEVVAIAELAPQVGGVADPADGRLVLLTAREIGARQGPPRVIRLIVEADTPLSSRSARPAARAL